MIETSDVRTLTLRLSAVTLVCAAPLATGQMAGAPPDRLFIRAMPADCGMSAEVTGEIVARGQDAGAGAPATIVTAPIAAAPIMGAAFASGARVVTDAPYSAVGRSETVRTLADGNRIVSSNTIRYFRDSRGRTRTEYTLSALGPIALKAERTMVVIDDPVAGKRFMVHPDAKIATEMPMAGCVQPAKGAAMAAVPFPGPPLPGGPDTLVFNAAADAPAPESAALPERTVNGLRAVGRRSEFAIAAGEVGNEQPITLTSETWYSPELQVVVSAVHRDPLVGDTTYQLENVVRKEPDARLFVVPKDYARPRLPEVAAERTWEVPVPQLRSGTAPATEVKPRRRTD